jgi:hypothetical protein
VPTVRICISADATRWTRLFHVKLIGRMMTVLKR